MTGLPPHSCDLGPSRLSPFAVAFTSQPLDYFCDSRDHTIRSARTNLRSLPLRCSTHKRERQTQTESDRQPTTWFTSAHQQSYVLRTATCKPPLPPRFFPCFDQPTLFGTIETREGHTTRSLAKIANLETVMSMPRPTENSTNTNNIHTFNISILSHSRPHTPSPSVTLRQPGPLPHTS